MNIDQKIQNVFKPFIGVCVPKQYGGKAEEFVVYSYSSDPLAFFDNKPFGLSYSISAHWFFPWKPNNIASDKVISKKQQIVQAFVDAGFFVLSVYPGDDDEWDEIVFEVSFESMESETV